MTDDTERNNTNRPSNNGKPGVAPPGSAIEAAITAAQEAEASLRRRKTDVLLAVAEEHWRPGKTDTGSPMAVPREGPPLAVIVGDRMGDTFKHELARLAHERTGEVPSGTVVGDVVRVLAAQGRACDPENVLLRVGYSRDQLRIVYDLGRSDHRAVVIEPGSWRVVEDLGRTVFRRTAITQPQVLPDESATPQDFNRLKEVLNLSPTGWQLLRSLMVVALIPEVPKPIGILTGEAGSGKSDATRFVIRVLDPQAAELQPPPKTIHDLTVSANASLVLGFDNLAQIKQELSDALCRLATGGGVRHRSLFTDRELAVFDQLCPVLINGIDLPQLRGDLVDRAAPIQLQRIRQEDRLTEADVQSRFERALPSIVGGLFATIAAAWERKPDVTLDVLPRMADAAIWFAAVDQVFNQLGEVSQSQQLLADSKQQLFRTIVESNELALAIVAFVDRHVGDTWSGTATELRHELARSGEPPWLPSTAQLMGANLRKIQTPLREAGLVDITFDRHPDQRLIHLTRLSKSTDPHAS